MGCRTLSFPERLAYLKKAGFPLNTWHTMLAISEAESSGNTCSVSPSSDYGWLQVNTINGGGPASFDPMYNAKQAYDVWKRQGFDAWCTYYDPTTGTTGCKGRGSGNARQFYLSPEIEKALHGHVPTVAGIAGGPPGVIGAEHAKDAVVKDATGALTGWMNPISQIFNRSLYVLLGFGMIIIGFYLLAHEQINSAATTAAAPEAKIAEGATL